MNYDNDIRIDEQGLDTEWLEQPRLMGKYARHEADMLDEFDRAKEKLDTTKAELDRAIRTNPEKYEIEKITDKVVENTILLQKAYKDAAKEMLEAKHEYNSAKGAVKAFDQRKDALENLVRLHGQRYFAGPNVPRDLPFEVQQKESQRRADEGVAGKMVRRRRDSE